MTSRPWTKAGVFKKIRLLNSTPTIATSVSSFNISVLVPKVVAIYMHMVDDIIPLLCHIAIHDTHPSVFLVYSLAVFSSTCRIQISPSPKKFFISIFTEGSYNIQVVTKRSIFRLTYLFFKFISKIVYRSRSLTFAHLGDLRNTQGNRPSPNQIIHAFLCYVD